MSSIYLTLVVPVYNEEATIRESWLVIHEELVKLQKPYEVIFVDDGSKDHTNEILIALRGEFPEIKILRFTKNHGHQIAITAGLDFASGQYTITMDVDLQHPPHLIPRFLEEAQKGVDIVSGIKEKTINRGFLKNALAYGFYKLLRWIAEIPIDPHVSDFRLYSYRALQTINSIRERDRYIRGLVSWTGFKQSYIPYTAPDRKTGYPKYTLKKLGQLAAYGIFSFSAFPTRLSLYIGFLIVLFNSIFLIGTIIHKLRHPSVIEGYTTILSFLLFLFSLLFIVLGIIGEYIFRVYQEVKRRPLYILESHEGLEGRPPLTPSAPIG